jgi:arylacetamide deacetylase-like 3/4
LLFKGGNIATVLSHKFSSINLNIPQQVVLIYPWLQMYNFNLPSYNQYRLKGLFFYSSLSVSKFAYWYLGFSNISTQMYDLLESNSHILLLDENQRKKFNSYTDVSLIPEKYKLDKSYYNKYDQKDITNLIANDSNLIEDLDENIKNRVINLFNSDASPGLADDHVLTKSPPTYFVILEWDPLKDECLIFSERLRKNNVSVEVAYYEDAFHGILPYLDSTNGYKISRKIFDDLANYLKKTFA